MDDIRQAQVEAGERAVVESLRAKGLLPPDPEVEHRRLKDAVLEAARADRASETRKLESNADLDVMVQSRRAFRLAVTALLEFEGRLPAPTTGEGG